MKVFLWRILLIVAMALAGLYLGGLIGATYLVPKNAGLASGAMVLGYAVLGAGGFAVAGLIAAFRLSGRVLRNVALIVAVPVLIWYLWLTVTSVLRARAEREPDSAFALAGQFRAEMERLDTSDPYLFVKMQVDSQTRTWTQTGPPPDHKVFHAAMQSRTLIDIRRALEALAALPDAEFAQCRAAGGPPVKQLKWVFSDTPSGSGVLELSKACINAHFQVARALSLIETVSQKPGGKVRRK